MSLDVRCHAGKYGPGQETLNRRVAVREFLWPLVPLNNKFRENSHF